MKGEPNGLGLCLLPFRESVEFRFSGSDEESCLLRLGADMYIEIRAEEPSGADVALLLWAPDGQLLRQIDTLPIGDHHTEVIAAVTPSAGIYRLTVKVETSGSYQVFWKTARPASPDDRLQGEAHAVFLEGEELRRANHWRDAQERYAEALRVWTGLGDRIWAGHALYRTGLLARWQDQNDQAIEAWEAALSFWRGTPNEPELLDQLGVVFSSLGEYQQAMKAYRRALALLPDPSLRRARVMGHFSELLMDLGEYDEALGLCRAALRIFEKEGAQEEMLLPLRTLGMIYTELGEEREALEILHKGEVLASTLGRPGTRAKLLNAMGNAHIVAERNQEARRVHEEALRLAEEAGDEGAIAHACGNLGYLTDQAGDPEEAIRLFERGIGIYQRKEEPLNRAQALSGKALALWHLGRFEEAQETLEQLIGLIESLRVGTGSSRLRTSFFSTRQRGYEIYLDLMMDRHQLQPNAGFDRLAFQISELTRSRSLLEDLEGLHLEGVTPELLGRVEGQDRTLVRAMAGRAVSLPPPADSPDARWDSGNEARLFSLVRPLSTSDLQELLGNDQTLVLAYKLGSKKSYLWLIGRDFVQSRELPGRGRIENEVRETRALLARSAERTIQARAVERTRRLAELLLGPIADKLKGRRLVVIPDGELHSFPFGVLPDPAHSGMPPEQKQRWWPVALIESYEMAYAPSASVLALIRKQAVSRPPAPKALAVLAPESDETAFLGSSSGDDRLAKLPPLPYSREEAEAILEGFSADLATVAIGADADLSLARSSILGRHEIIHFAGHALVDPSDLARSGLVLSGTDSLGRLRREMLYMEEIHKLNLPVGLVVLSACRTATGKEIPGEGLVGLTRAFFYAGSSRVVASLWDIRDSATRELMDRFYDEMKERELTPTAALREAQIAMLRDNRRQAPYYWGGFVLQGEWR